MARTKRILIVDDDTDDQNFFCDALEQITNDVDCVMAENGKEALRHLESPPPYDLIFLDLNMPKMNGFVTLSIIKNDNRYKDIPIVILSTTRNPHDIEKCKSLGADHFLSKPDRIQDYVSGLRRFFAA